MEIIPCILDPKGSDQSPFEHLSGYPEMSVSGMGMNLRKLICRFMN